MRRLNPLTGLRPRIAALVLGGVLVLAAVMMSVSANSVNDAYERAARSELTPIATTWQDGFDVSDLADAALMQQRVQRLRDANPNLIKIAVSWHDIHGDTQVAEAGGGPVGRAPAIDVGDEPRAGDVCGRVGGDGFMLALIDADLGLADQIVDRVRSRVEVTFSAGIVAYSIDFALSAEEAAERLTEDRIEQVRTAGVLHDIGKIGIPDAVLLKPARPDAGEFDVMRRHSELGRDIIAGAGLEEIATWVLHLHERFDGRGYPHGLAAHDIPLESRILQCADALEAMTSSRIYRPGMEVERALAELERGAGSQFDPQVAPVLVEMVRGALLTDRTTARSHRA